MTLLSTILAFIVVLGAVIVVHEFGHYLAARACNVKVLRFSVGFGRPLMAWRRGKDRTEWVLAAIPFGGYVKMLDERESQVDPDELGRAFNRQSVWRRILIVAAGPAFNLAFAVMLYAGLYMYGLPEAKPVVAEPAAGTMARAAGFEAGDIVRSVDGAVTQTWQEVRWQVLQAALRRDTVRIEVIDVRDRINSYRLDLGALEDRDIEGDILGRLGLRLQMPKLTPVIGTVEAQGPAQRAGMQAGDRILTIDDVAVETWADLVRTVRASAGKQLSIRIERDGQGVTLEVVPDETGARGSPVGRIGVSPRDLDRFYVRVSHGPLESIAKAAGKTLELSVFSLKMLGKMILGEVSWKHLSGPVTIADYAGQSAQLGWISYLTFVALISISLGVLNLLPIPLLDGGHLLYYGIEILKGSPVSERVWELGQRVGIALLLVMMAFAFYNDLNRLFSG
ncbi:MAG: RIP metalloprotease RseP [Bradyrhizobium sp.]|uniref:RIP metalloprotease RseP n=1 Tax=Bradyrhizobium sp. TaxID=376 RepID=UPI003D0C7388